MIKYLIHLYTLSHIKDKRCNINKITYIYLYLYIFQNKLQTIKFPYENYLSVKKSTEIKTLNLNEILFKRDL